MCWILYDVVLVALSFLSNWLDEQWDGWSLFGEEGGERVSVWKFKIIY